MKPIDLRSDTVTRPTPAMREAMARAEVGDDVYGEDPSVNRLQELAARLLGKEAALFVPSGTMGNQASLRALTRAGDVVLAGEGAHVLHYEAGAAAGLSGLQIQTIGRGGLFDAADVAAAIPPDDVHHAPVRVVALENTHTRSGGRVFPLERIAGIAELAKERGLCLHLDGARLWNAVVAIAELAKERGLCLHLDGARLWNAVVATGIPAARWAAPFDTATFCLSKGLGAPVGSVVCGSADRIRRVLRARKMMGGGMRQAGIVAAAGIFALEHHVERLAQDHRNAGRLATGLERLGCRLCPPPETNMVFFELPAGADQGSFERAVAARELLVDAILPGRFRAVTHLDVADPDVDDALGRFEEALKEALA